MNTSVAKTPAVPLATQPFEEAPLSTWIRIASGFTRSINLGRDQDSLDLLAAYVPTTRAIAALEQIVAGLGRDSHPRAHALIGPYGSGKSAFGLFVGALVAPPGNPAQRIAIKRLNEAQAFLARRLEKQLADTQGLLRIQINGIPDSLVRQVMLALAESCQREDLPEQLTDRIRKAAKPGYRMDRVLKRIGEVQQAWADKGGAGILLEIDELGKFLEYEAHHPGQREIHLLQLLAEKASEPGKAPLHLLVMLHQAFEHYSNHLGKTLREEWKKVQGRFGAIAFLEPAEQALRVVGAAFEHQAELPPDLSEQLFELAGALTESSALPMGMDLASASELFQRCYPLHPVTLLILPVLCQKVAQNERTLFSYLASTEPFGLTRRLAELKLGQWIEPWELYDYFILNQAGGFADPLTYHRWVEVATALERFEGEQETDGEDPALRLLKTIGLLNLIGAQRGLKASASVLRLLFKEQTDELIERLEERSIIQLRRYAQEYRVWQGSDFDLHGALLQVTSEQAARSLPDTLNTLAPLPPVVARRASIETGTFRRFDIAFTSAERWPPKTTAELQLWLYLAEPDEVPLQKGNKAASDHGEYLSVDLTKLPKHHILAVCHTSEQLREVVSEWLALKEMPAQFAALQQDPVAQREHQAWLQNAESEALTSIRGLLEEPEALSWYFAGQREPILDRRQLQQALSQWVQEIVFSQSPIIRNELINRDYPSPAASTGRKKLLAAMLKAPDQDGLGIEKAPAEKSLYLSLLRESRLHRPGPDGRWDFFPPDPDNDPCNLYPAWSAIHQILGDAGERQVPLPEIYAQLQAKPYGVRAGILPILLITYLLAHRRETAFYQEGAFSETLGIEQAELLCRRPALFAIERFELSGLRGELFQQYLGSIVGNLREDATLLDIVRPLVRFAQQLPEYTQHCGGLSAEAERVRGAFRQAKSPGTLLFEALPQACGFEPEALFATPQGRTTTNNEIEAFIARLIAVLRELDSSYPALLEEWRARLNQTVLQKPANTPLEETRQALGRRYQGLDRYASQQGTLGAFIRRLTDTRHEDDRAWLESLMTLLAKAPPTKWQDAHRVNAELRLAEMAEQLGDLEVLGQSLADREGTENSDDQTLLFKLVRPGQDEQRHLVHLNARQQQQAESTAKQLAGRLEGLDAATQAAVLARLLDQMAPMPSDDTKELAQGQPAIEGDTEND